MATAQQIKALLQSYSEADAEHFVSVAMQIAAHEARSGRAKMAAELKALIDEIQAKQRQRSSVGAVPIARPKGELASLLAVSYPKTHLSEMVLAPDQRDSLERVLLEYRQLSKLQGHGLSPRRKLLLVGPPGVGKTMTSWALAGELRLPHFTVQFHSLITKYMGETAAKLHAVFEAMQHTRGVYLFDEFDAIGGERAGSHDVGEIRRVLNSFLQFLEQDESDSLILAATNLERMLDDALYRRFDDVITYHLPTRDELKHLLANRLSAFRTKESVDFDIVATAAEGLSHADVCKACQDAAKDAVLHDKREIDSNVLLSSLQKRRRHRQP